MNPVHVIVYASSSTQLLSQQELEELLVVARRNNTRDDITGLLLYEGGNFLQILEGPKPILDATYERIKKDTRHKGLITLISKGFSGRNFSEWSMGYTRLTEQKFEEEQPGFNSMLERTPPS